MRMRREFWYLGLIGALLVGMAAIWPPVPAAGADPKTHTVGAAGCEYTTIQAAVDDDAVAPGDVLSIVDAVHTEGGIVVRKDVTIQGQGADRTVVQAHATAEEARQRVFFVEKGAVVVLRDLTIRHGNPVLDEYFRSGGGVLNRGTVTIENCVITHNTANNGGGLWNNRGTVTVVNSTISDNVADRVAPPGYECGSGGGIKLEGGGTLVLVDSTISHNQARGKGGGLFVACETTATLTNCTISGNQAVDYGGGLFTKNVLHLIHCTVVDNSVGAEGSSMVVDNPIGAAGGGGGVYVRTTLHFTNTIIANNGKARDCVIGGPGDYRGKGQIGANVNNLIGDGSYPSAYTGDPLLGELAHNGGDTQTHALLPGSQAVDAVPASDCVVAVDQRGVPRPVACTSSDTPGDIGAFELQPSEVPPAITPAPSPIPSAAPTRMPPVTPTLPPATFAMPGGTLLGLGLLGALALILVGAILVWVRRR